MSRASSASVRVSNVAEPAIGGRESPIGRPREDAVRMTGALAPSSEDAAGVSMASSRMNRNGRPMMHDDDDGDAAAKRRAEMYATNPYLQGTSYGGFGVGTGTAPSSPTGPGRFATAKPTTSEETSSRSYGMTFLEQLARWR